MDRYKNARLNIGSDKGPAQPQGDWNRISAHALRSVESIEKCLQEIRQAQGITKSRKFAASLCVKSKRATGKKASERKKLDGQKKVVHTRSWIAFVAKARNALGLPRNEKFPKGSAVYLKAKELQAAEKAAK